MKNILLKIFNTETKKKLFDGLVAYTLMIFCSWLFVELAEQVIKKGTIPFEKNFLLFLNSLSNPFLDKFMRLVTELAGIYFVIIFTLFLGWYLYLKRNYKNTLFLALSVLGTVLLNTLLKFIVKRPRPELWKQLINEKFYSFPSGHAMISMALALVIIFIFWKHPQKKLIRIISILYVVLIGLSRMYLGVHYPSDILGGWLMSSAWIILLQRIIYKEDEDFVDLIS